MALLGVALTVATIALTGYLFYVIPKGLFPVEDTGFLTVATEAAHRLGITRVTSTDFVRQTMRAFGAELAAQVREQI